MSRTEKQQLLDALDLADALDEMFDHENEQELKWPDDFDPNDPDRPEEPEFPDRDVEAFKRGEVEPLVKHILCGSVPFGARKLVAQILRDPKNRVNGHAARRARARYEKKRIAFAFLWFREYGKTRQQAIGAVTHALGFERSTIENAIAEYKDFKLGEGPALSAKMQGRRARIKATRLARRRALKRAKDKIIRIGAMLAEAERHDPAAAEHPEFVRVKGWLAEIAEIERENNKQQGSEQDSNEIENSLD